MAALRYVELNPVAAGLAARAEAWRWSSAASHVAGRRTAHDPLTDVAALRAHVPNWRAMLRHGLEASELGPAGEDVAERIEARLRTGRPLAGADWIARREEELGRSLLPGKRGPRGKAAGSE